MGRKAANTFDVRRVDDLFPHERIGFMHFDVEGHELQVLHPCWAAPHIVHLLLHTVSVCAFASLSGC